MNINYGGPNAEWMKNIDGSLVCIDACA